MLDQKKAEGTKFRRPGFQLGNSGEQKTGPRRRVFRRRLNATGSLARVRAWRAYPGALVEAYLTTGITLGDVIEVGAVLGWIG
jgi:hypothetical protein